MHQVQERDEDDGPDALQPLPQDQRQAGRHQHHPRPGDETHALQVLYQQHTVLYKLPVSSDTVFSKRFRGVIKNGHKNQKCKNFTIAINGPCRWVGIGKNKGKTSRDTVL